MVNYRRARLAGATHFFTVTSRNRNARLLTDYIDCLRESFKIVKIQRPFQIDAIVVLPDHLHGIWTLPEGDRDLAGQWRAIKSRFTRAIKDSGIVLKRDAWGEHDLWQRRFWEHLIRDEMDLSRHVDYIHYSPVKHGLVTQPANWPWSSFHRYVRRGLVAADWAVEPSNGEFGE